MERANKPPASTKPRSSPTDGSLCARASPAIAARLEEKTGSGAGAAVVWSTRARTQQPRVPTIGWLSLSTEPTVRTALEAFRSGLADLGYTEGKNIRVLYRYADIPRAGPARGRWEGPPLPGHQVPRLRPRGGGHQR